MIFKLPLYLYILFWWKIQVNNNEFHYSLSPAYSSTIPEIALLQRIANSLTKPNIFTSVYHMCSYYSIGHLWKICKAIHKLKGL